MPRPRLDVDRSVFLATRALFLFVGSPFLILESAENIGKILELFMLLPRLSEVFNEETHNIFHLEGVQVGLVQTTPLWGTCQILPFSQHWNKI